MRHWIFIAVLLATPATAQEDEPGTSLMERGMQLFMEGLMQEVEPTLRDLQDFAEGVQPALRSFIQEMGPALQELLADVQDWSAYHPPEVLPNGDIILRKKTPEELDLQEGTEAPPGEIDI